MEAMTTYNYKQADTRASSWTTNASKASMTAMPTRPNDRIATISPWQKQRPTWPPSKMYSHPVHKNRKNRLTLTRSRSTAMQMKPFETVCRYCWPPSTPFSLTCSPPRLNFRTPCWQITTPSCTILPRITDFRLPLHLWSILYWIGKNPSCPCEMKSKASAASPTAKPFTRNRAKVKNRPPREPVKAIPVHQAEQAATQKLVAVVPAQILTTLFLRYLLRHQKRKPNHPRP